MNIPNDVCYRIFDDGEKSLGVVMRVKENKLVLLEKEALVAWRQVVEDGGSGLSGRNNSMMDTFESLGLVECGQGKPIKKTKESGIKTGLTEVDTSVLNYFAFRNRIPLAGHFELTQKCNLKCRHCFCVTHGGKDGLSTGDWFRIIDDLAANGAMFLVLTGGELFMRKDIMDILQKLHDRGFVLRINTNGTRIDEHVVQELSRFGNIFRIHVSVYGATSEVHDNITRVPGSFSKTVKALEMLKEAGFRLRINCSVMTSNLHAYKDIYKMIAQPINIPIHIDPSIFPMDDYSGRNRGEQLSAEDIGDVRRYKQKIGASTDEENKGKHQLCRAATSFFSVTSKGDVYPCLKMKRIYGNPLGNLMDMDFRTIWHSTRLNTIRESMERTLSECDLCDVVI